MNLNGNQETLNSSKTERHLALNGTPLITSRTENDPVSNISHVSLPSSSLDRDPLRVATIESGVLSAPKTQHEMARDALVSRCQIEMLGASRVSFVLPETLSRREFLLEVQALTQGLLGREYMSPRGLQQFSEYTPSLHDDLKINLIRRDSPQRIMIDANVRLSTGMTRAEQEARGWANVDIGDLVVAHAAFFLLTGEDLFCGNSVRARGGEAYFGRQLGSLIARYAQHSTNVDFDQEEFIVACQDLMPDQLVA